VVNSVRRELPGRAASPVRLDSLDRSDKEAELQGWLEDQGVEASWEFAPVLVALRWSVQELASMTDGLSQPQVIAFLRWLGVACTVYSLLEEVSEGASRISEIVKAVRSYSYLDQAPVQLLDVHEGLENTLVILRHKLKQGVTVHREFATDLPRIEAYASELNQVWTNLIDNAVDAMGGKGEITLRTYGENRHVVVEITDNGPGIPPEIRPRIFDAFFTTKPPGAGTGLGLHISYNIIVNQHHGEIAVESAPGHTTFRVRLPVQLSAAAENSNADVVTA
jgi:signal transduction histidine kinase